LTTVAGGVPCAKTLKNLVTDGLMLVGDAAHQANPVSGGGIVSGMIAAKIAGIIAAKAVREKDISAQNLGDYQRQWQDAEGKTHERFYKIKEAIFKLSNDDLNQIADTLLKVPMEKRTLLKLFTTALINQPKLVVEAAKIFVS
jgi:digeranylgeranylglycerophospholipid reductase